MFYIFALSVFLCAFFLPEQKPLQHFVLKGAAQGTSYSIQYYADAERLRQSAIDSLFQVVDASMSLYQANSLINQFNQGKEVVMDEHLRRVMQEAFLINKQTDGVFDVTVGSLSRLWGQSPDEKAIADAKMHVGMHLLSMEQSKLIKKEPGVQIDLNGIAQGYTVDLLSAYLIKRGITSFIVELGGEIYAHGKKPDGSTYKVAIERPDSLVGQTMAIALENASVTTSANFDEKKHLINPRTGYPVESDILSATVYAPAAIIADGYDNALIGMGLDKALKWLHDYPELGAYFIFKDVNGIVRDTATTSFKQKSLDNKS